MARGIVVHAGWVGDRGPQGEPGPPVQLKPAVATVGDLPAVGNAVNDTRTVNADGHGYQWDGSAWQDVGLLRGPAGTTWLDGGAPDSSYGGVTEIEGGTP